MMDKDYANRMLITDLLLFGLIFFVILYGLKEQEPEVNMTPPATEQVVEVEEE